MQRAVAFAQFAYLEREAVLLASEIYADIDDCRASPCRLSPRRCLRLGMVHCCRAKSLGDLIHSDRIGGL